MPSKTVFSDSESLVFVAATSYMSPARADKIRFTYEIYKIQSGAEACPAYQVADEPDSPTTYVVGDYQTTTGIKTPTGYVSIFSNTSGKQLMRLGWVIKNTQGTGSGVHLASLGGMAELLLL